MWGVSYTPHADFFLWGVSFTWSMLASLCEEFLLYKTREQKSETSKIKSNKNLHNWAMLLFKAEGDVTYRLQKVWKKYKPVKQ